MVYLLTCVIPHKKCYHLRLLFTIRLISMELQNLHFPQSLPPVKTQLNFLLQELHWYQKINFFTLTYEIINYFFNLYKYLKNIKKRNKHLLKSINLHCIPTGEDDDCLLVNTKQYLPLGVLFIQQKSKIIKFIINFITN